MTRPRHSCVGRSATPPAPCRHTQAASSRARGPDRDGSRGRRRQSGVVLVISLIVLVALSLAGISLMRSTDTGNMISGNMAFRMAALQAVDTGVEAAFTGITSASGFGAAPTVGTTTGAGQYSPVLLTDAAPADGVPDVTWSALPGTTVSGNTVRWVVERMCSQNVSAPSDIVQRCATVPQNFSDSKKANNPSPTNSATLVAYRVTIRVEGPRNTVVLSQAVITM